MSLKYANQLSDGQLKEIYQSFLCEDNKIPEISTKSIENTC